MWSSNILGGIAMKFIKPTNVHFNKRDLEMAILSLTDKPKETYKISVRNSYPCLCIGHKHYYVHRVLGEFYFGNLDGYAIHHINGEKLDNTRKNLRKIVNAEHTKLHHTGNDFRSKDGMMKSVNAMAKKRKREDVKSEDVKRLREQGMTYKQLAEYFHCGQSVIKNRLE